MPITIQNNKLQIRNAEGNYVSIDAVSDATVAERIAEINEAGATNVTSVNTAGTTNVGNVNSAGATQISAIEAKAAEAKSDLTSPGEVKDMIADSYSDQKTYAVGDYVVYTDNSNVSKLYRCTTAITTAEAWTAAHWTETQVGDDIGELKSALSKISGNEIIQFANGLYIKDNVSIGSTVNLTPISGSSRNNYAIIDTTGGEKFTINGTGGSEGRLWAFIDSSDQLIDVANASISAENLVIEAPANAAKLILNTLDTPGLCCRREYIKDTVRKINRAVDVMAKAVTGDTIFSWNDTSAVGSNRKWFYYQFEKGVEYTVDVDINKIPSKGTSTHFQAATVRSYGTTPANVIVDTLTESKTYHSGDSLTFKYIPTNDAMGLYLYISAAETSDIDIGITVKQNIFNAVTDEYDNYSGLNYLTIACVTKLAGDMNSYYYSAFQMKSGETYHFRVLIDLRDVELNQGAGTIYAFSADNPNTSAHDIIIRGSYRTSENQTTGLKKWYYFDYTAQSDTIYIATIIQNCGAGSTVLLQCALDNYPIISKETFSIESEGGRCIFDSKPYLFKRVGYFNGVGQSIAQTGNVLYLALGGHTPDGKIKKYINNVFVEEKTLAEIEHPFNLTILKNGNLLIANIIGYGEETDTRYVYEYNYETNTIINTYMPIVEDKKLVFSDQIDDTTLLLGYKDISETQHITYWYSYDTISDTPTLISSTTRERIYVQGGCLRGNIVYMSENNKASGGLAKPPQILSVNYKTGEILNKITCYGFGETEGCYISKDQGSGIYAYFLENSTRIWCLKLR